MTTVEFGKAQELKMAEIRDEWISAALSGDSSLALDQAKEGVAWLYGLAKLPTPMTIVVDSPLGACMAARLFGAKVDNTATIGLGYDAGWVAFYDFFSRVEVPHRNGGEAFRLEHEGLQHLIRFVRSGVWDCVLLKGAAILSRRPEKVSKDERGRLHCADGPAVRFRDGFSVWSWHGARMTERHIMQPESFTAEEIQAERNSEIVRALSEKLGIEKFLDRLGTKSIDQWTDPVTGLAYELLDPAHRSGDDQPRYLRMQSPPLNDASQPTYFEAVPPDIKSAQAARKWQVVLPDGTWPSVDLCNREAALTFAMER